MNTVQSFLRVLVVACATLIVTTIVTAGDEPGEEATPTSQQASPTEKSTPIVIDNETLQRYSDQGRITEVSTPQSKDPAARPGAAPRFGDEGVLASDAFGADGQATSDEKREYWRDRYKRQLDMVADIEQQIEALDHEIPGLWRDFYAWDDPMYRDGVIKPKLDEALARRDRLEQKLAEERDRLPTIREGARRDGAKPGWFRGMGTTSTDAGRMENPDGSKLADDLDMDVAPAAPTDDN
jgi:hypothetical protein